MRLSEIAALGVAVLAFRAVSMRKIPTLIAVESNHDEIIRFSAPVAWRNYLAARKLAEATSCGLKQAEWSRIARFSLNVHFWKVETDRQTPVFPDFWQKIVSESAK